MSIVAAATTTTTITDRTSSSFSSSYFKANEFLRRHAPSRGLFPNQIRCCFDDSKPRRRGFGPPQPSPSSSKAKKVTTSKEDNNGMVVSQRNSTSQQSGTSPTQAPGLSTRNVGKPKSISLDLQFEERLEAVKRSAIEQKKAEESKEYGAIDYDAPVETARSTIGLGTKIGVGVAVTVFGLVFALGDFLPSGSVSPTEDATVVNNKISEEDKTNLQKRLQQYEATLRSSPEDSTALEGAAVTLVELGEYTQAASLLEDLTKKKPSDPDVFRLLGEVKYELKDYEGSAAAYRSSTTASKTIDFEVLRGLTNALLAAKRPDEAVQVLMASRESMNAEKSKGGNIHSDSSTLETKSQVDPIQVELLLGKAYSVWGHFSDAVSVYDQLISSHPDDFRGYLAKGIILKENGKVGDAERMFIQARFFATEKAKALVDRYSRQ